MTRADVNAYVEGRLSGTVWASSIAAKTVYGRCMRAGQTLGGLGVSPNALTYGSLAFALVAGGAAALGYLFWAACFLILSGVCDVLDGMVARATGHVTKFGALLDSTVDRLSDALPLLGLVVFLAPWGGWVAVPAAAMLGAVSVSYVRARAEGLGVKLPPLFMRRAERLLLLVTTLILAAIPWGGSRNALDGELGLPQLLLVAGLGIMALLSFAAALAALVAARRALEVEAATSPEPFRDVGSPHPLSADANHGSSAGQ